jgi:hypothetical protein
LFGKLNESSRRLRQQDATVVEAAVTGLLSGVGTSNRFTSVYGAADQVARTSQAHWKWQVQLVSALSAAALIGLQVYSSIWMSRPALEIVLALAVTSAGLFGLYFRRGRSAETDYLDYRALAEAMRVQYFWDLVGYDGRVADHYLMGKRNGLGWIVDGLLCICALRPRSVETAAGPADELARLSQASKYWVEHQLEYFGRQSEPRSPGSGKAREFQMRAARLQTWLGRPLLFGALLAFLVVVVLQLATTSGVAINVAMMVMSSLTTLFAISRAYLVVMGYEKTALRYHLMGAVYASAKLEIHQAIAEGKADTARQLLGALGREALDENADWHVLHRDNSFSLPWV